MSLLERIRKLQRYLDNSSEDLEAWRELVKLEARAGLLGQTEVEDRETESDSRRLVIVGELYHVSDVTEGAFDNLPRIETDEGEEFFLAEDPESAGEAVREYWADMARLDPSEFTTMIGEGTLVSWALGVYAGPGSTQVKSLDEWLDLWKDSPEEHLASYDSAQRDINRVGKLANDLGFTPTVAYRC